MSGISFNRNKKNAKKSKFIDVPVVQVKSLKLEPNKAKSDGKNNAKSENDLRKSRKSTANSSKSTGFSHESNGDALNELDACIIKRFKTLNINGEGQNMVPAKTAEKTPEGSADLQKTGKAPNEQSLIPIISEHAPDSSENLEDYASYKFYNNKNSKSIKFTNQVTVLYFNGEDILCESMEPLKKELDQQIRNKEMRKEHLMSKGQFDNVYLF